MFYDAYFSVGFPVRYTVAIVTSGIAVVITVIVYMTWLYCKKKRHRFQWYESSDDDCSPNAIHASSHLKISQSTPELNKHFLEDEGPGKKGVFKLTNVRQSTLPTVSQRHELFKRQLSHKLDLSNIEFQVQSVKHKEQPNLGVIKPELYKQVSIDSVKSEHCICGKLFFTLLYSHGSESLVVNILRCEELPAKDFSGTSDPYVKIYLLPDRKHKCQTKVHRKTLSPEFNEKFAFSVSYKELTSRVLQFNIYDFDRFSRHDLIGTVVVKDILCEGSLTNETFFVRDVMSANQVRFQNATWRDFYVLKIQIRDCHCIFFYNKIENGWKTKKFKSFQRIKLPYCIRMMDT